MTISVAIHQPASFVLAGVCLHAVPRRRVSAIFVNGKKEDAMVKKVHGNLCLKVREMCKDEKK